MAEQRIVCVWIMVYGVWCEPYLIHEVPQGIQLHEPNQHGEHRLLTEEGEKLLDASYTMWCDEMRCDVM